MVPPLDGGGVTGGGGGGGVVVGVVTLKLPPEEPDVCVLPMKTLPLVASAGTTNETCVSLTTDTGAGDDAPTCAVVAAVKPEPLTTICVPTGPEAGVKPEMLGVGTGGGVGAGGGVGMGAGGGGSGGGGVVAVVTLNRYGENEEYWGLRTLKPADVALVEIVTRICESLTTVNGRFLSAPSQTTVVPDRPEPEIVTTVPAGPDFGEKPLINCCVYVVPVLAVFAGTLAALAILATPTATPRTTANSLRPTRCEMKDRGRAKTILIFFSEAAVLALNDTSRKCLMRGDFIGGREKRCRAASDERSRVRDERSYRVGTALGAVASA